MTHEYLLPVVQEARELSMSNDNVELEIRFGRYDHVNRRFVPGVTEDFQKCILEMLDEFDGWDSQTDWIERVDYFYELQRAHKRTRHDHASSSNRRPDLIRTTVTHDKILCTEHIRKEKVSQRTLQFVEGINARASSIINDHCDLRVSLNCEHHVDAEFIPEVVQPVLVRIKSSRTFRHKAFEFVISRVYSGRTRADAEIAQRTSVPTYEVECECIDLKNYCDAHSDSYIAKSILMKLTDFYQRSKDQFHFNLIE